MYSEEGMEMNRDELNVLSDQELLELEDRLLLERESDTQFRVKHTGGRFIIIVLSILIWLVLKMIFIKLTGSLTQEMRGIVSVIVFFVTLFLSVIISQAIWNRIGISARFFLRNALHYWPVVMYLVIGVISYVKIVSV